MNPKRRFFQIHLSTAVVLMLVAGVLVWANVRERKTRVNVSGWEIDIYSQGWPMTFDLYWDVDFQKHLHLLISPFSAFVRNLDDKFSYTRAIYNALIALAILLSVCVACEWRIRRRAVLPQKSP